MCWACERQVSIFIVLRSKTSRGKDAKLHAVAASNKRDHPLRSLGYFLFASRIFVSGSLRTSCSWWIALSTQHQLRGCNNIAFFLQWTALIAHFLWRLHLAPHSDSGQSTTLLWAESAQIKLHTVAESNNGDPTPCSFYLCLFAPHIYWCCSSRTSHL